MNLPDGERLLLTLDREVDATCQRCGGFKYKVPCETCQGTGLVKRRLRGIVPVEVEVFEPDYSSPCLHFDVPGWWAAELTVEGLANRLVTDYLNGSLPEKIRNYLQEVDEDLT